MRCATSSVARRPNGSPHAALDQRETAVVEGKTEPVFLACQQRRADLDHAGVRDENRLGGQLGEKIRDPRAQRGHRLAAGRTEMQRVLRPGVQQAALEAFPRLHFPVAEIELAQPLIDDRRRM